MKAKPFREFFYYKIVAIFKKSHTVIYKRCIFKLTIKVSNGTSKLFYFFYADKKVILTNGYIKKTQKTINGELEKALKYKIDFERRNKND